MFAVSTVFVSLLAVLSVSAGPITARKSNKSCDIQTTAIVATITDAPITNYFLGIGKGGVPILTEAQTGGLAPDAGDGSLGFYSGKSCKEKFLNYGKDGSGLFDTQGLVFQSKAKLFNWETPVGENIRNSEIQSDTFQVCESNGEWVVSLNTEVSIDDPSCYYTNLVVATSD